MEQKCDVEWPGVTQVCTRWNCISDLCHQCFIITVQIYVHCSRGTVCEMVLLMQKYTSAFKVFYCKFLTIWQHLHNLWLPINRLTEAELNFFMFRMLLCITSTSQKSLKTGLSKVYCTCIWRWQLYYYFMESAQGYKAHKFHIFKSCRAVITHFTKPSLNFKYFSFVTDCIHAHFFLCWFWFSSSEKKVRHITWRTWAEIKNSHPYFQCVWVT